MSYYRSYYKRHMRTEHKAAIFGMFLLTVLLISFVTIALSSDPLILGTEMNTDGLVEYLCLGRGCETVY